MRPSRSPANKETSRESTVQHVIGLGNRMVAIRLFSFDERSAEFDLVDEGDQILTVESREQVKYLA